MKKQEKIKQAVVSDISIKVPAVYFKSSSISKKHYKANPVIR